MIRDGKLFGIAPFAMALFVLPWYLALIRALSRALLRALPDGPIKSLLSRQIGACKASQKRVSLRRQSTKPGHRRL